MNEENRKLLTAMLDKYERQLILGADAAVGYLLAVMGTLLMEIIWNRQGFSTMDGFLDHLFAALRSGVVGSGLYMWQKPSRKPGQENTSFISK